VTEVSAAALEAALKAAAEPALLPKVRSRLAPDEPAFGLRMNVLFDIAKAHADLPLDQVERLLDHPAYEPRMAAFCILDFKARRRIDDDVRHSLHDLYLVGRDLGVLHELAAAAPHRHHRAAVDRVVGQRRGGRRVPRYRGRVGRRPRSRRAQACLHLPQVRRAAGPGAAAGLP
jgi:hypothetical protein